MTRADRIWLALLDGPMPVVHLASAVGMRRADVRAELEANPDRFVHNGRRARASAWGIRSFDVASAAEHFGVSVELAEEFLTGAEGFLEHGYVASLNGNGGPFVVTELGREIAYDVEWLGPLA